MSRDLPLVTVSGLPATGTTTIAELLASEYNFEVLSGGDIFRQMASERGVTLAELTEQSRTNPEIDKEVDERLQEEIQSHLDGSRVPDGDGLIVESRLAAWHADGNATVTVYLHASPEVRSSRISDRDETLAELESRADSEIKRYQSHYGVDVTDESHYDLLIDTGRLTVQEVLNQIRPHLPPVTQD